MDEATCAPKKSQCALKIYGYKFSLAQKFPDARVDKFLLRLELFANVSLEFVLQIQISLNSRCVLRFPIASLPFLVVPPIHYRATRKNMFGLPVAKSSINQSIVQAIDQFIDR